MRRPFELPGIQDLRKAQEWVRALPSADRHLVIGGSGTGKSVLALLRARRHAGKKEPYIFLVFNRLLHEAAAFLAEKRSNSSNGSLTFLTPNSTVLRLAPQQNSQWQDTDWDGVDTVLANLDEPPRPRKEFAIIDEGQDIPPTFYNTLVWMGLFPMLLPKKGLRPFLQPL